MKFSKGLPLLAVGLCVPGVALRALHLRGGFEAGSGLPLPGNGWLWCCIALFAVCAVLYAGLARPLAARGAQPFEQLLGTDSPLFRVAAVIAGLLLLVGGVFYLYLTATTVEQDAVGWARPVEWVYALVTLLAGACAIGLAKAQGHEMTATSAKLTLPPLLWSCLHLLVTYRMTCTDPKLPSFAFGLVGDVLVVLAFYQLARLLYDKPQPALLAFFAALAATVCLSDLGGYGLAWLMGVRTVVWPAKMVLRGMLSAAACLLLLAELSVLTAGRVQQAQGVSGGAPDDATI